MPTKFVSHISGSSSIATIVDETTKFRTDYHDDLPIKTRVPRHVILLAAKMLFRAGAKIEGIRLIRNTYNLGLKESKDLVEALDRENYNPTDDLSYYENIAKPI